MVVETVLAYLWETLKLWLFTIFVAPFRNFDMLWILIPVYMTWFFAEFFQEKHGTSMGNAVTNAVVVFWGGFDWTRNTVNKLIENSITVWPHAIGRFALCACLVAYGFIIVILGLKGNKLIKYIGRIREVTYVIIIFTPIFYEVLELTWQHLLAFVLFFPIYYFFIELLDKYMPNPKAVVEDMNAASGGAESIGSGSFGSDLGGDLSGGSSGEDLGSMGDLGGGKEPEDLKI